MAKKRSSGRRKLLRARDKRRVVKMAVNEEYGTSRIKKELNLKCSRTLVWDVLRDDKNIKYAKKKKKPKLTADHKKNKIAVGQEAYVLG